MIIPAGASSRNSLTKRWWLHARARGIPTAAAVLVLIAVAAWISAEALTAGHLGAVQRRVPVIAAAPFLGILIFSAGLAGADPDLEQVTPTRWRRRRAWHLAGILVTAVVLLAATVLTHPGEYGAAAMARNVLGYLGMTTLSAVLMGATLAWVPPLLYAVTVYLAASSQPTGGAAWWAWPMQPGGWDNSWTVAILLVLAGCVAYICWGDRATARAPS